MSSIAISSIVFACVFGGTTWCASLRHCCRYNAYGAPIVGRLTENILARQMETWGLSPPYAVQARLIKKVFDDQISLDMQPRVSTVHRFQGSQCPTIILDSVQSYPERVGILLDDSMPNSDAARLLNVAIAKAETKLIIVANLRFLQARLSSSSIFMKIVERCIRTGTVIDATTSMSGLRHRYVVSPMCPGRTMSFRWTRWDSNPGPPHCERGKI